MDLYNMPAIIDKADELSKVEKRKPEKDHCVVSSYDCMHRTEATKGESRKDVAENEIGIGQV